jgi:hypothetical protein
MPVPPYGGILEKRGISPYGETPAFYTLAFQRDEGKIHVDKEKIMTRKTLRKGTALVLTAALALAVCGKAQAQTSGNPLANTTWNYTEKDLPLTMTISFLGAADVTVVQSIFHKKGDIKRVNGQRSGTYAEDETELNSYKGTYKVSGGKATIEAISASGGGAFYTFIIRGNTLIDEDDEDTKFTKVQ